MLQQAVVAGGIALVIGASLLFLLGERLRWAHWFVSLAGGAVVFGAAIRLHAVLAAGSIPFGTGVALGVLATAVVATVFSEWTSVGQLLFTTVAVASVTFVSYAVYVIVQARLGPLSLVFASLLLLLQAAVLVLLLAHTYEIVDVICRNGWRRQEGARRVDGYAPMVSIHVPTHDEPPEMVVETLDALAALDYPAFEVLVIDNNTKDEALWRPVEERCRSLGPRFRFFHLLPWPGFKSGALNFGLRQTAPEAEIVGIVDADYIVERGFLSDLVGHFHDPKVAFVQTPQDYRDQESRGTFGRALYLAYQYFFKVSMATRNEHNAIIFAGTMGLVRRRALEEVGGWDEWCITEDAELALRLLNAGYESVFVDRTYGRGLMPLDYAGLKRQRFRWAFGGMQLLRLHAGLLFRPGKDSRLTWAQRFAFVSGGLQWLNDPLATAFLVILFLGTGSLLAGGSLFLQPLVGAALIVPLLFLLFAVGRFLWAFRVRTGCRWGEAGRALVILLGLTWVVTLACLRGLVSRQGVFLRTPKSGDQPSAATAARVVFWEGLLALVCAGLVAAFLATERGGLLSARGLVVALLLWNGAVQGSAPLSSFWSWSEARAAVGAGEANLHTRGQWPGRLLPERRTAIWVGSMAVVAAALYFLSQRLAPPWERIMRADPRNQFFSAVSVLPRHPAEAAGGLLVLEGDAARRGDVAAALALWERTGRIVDHNFTPLDPSDDRFWSGLDGLRERYENEFRLRHYERLEHRNPRVVVHGDEAIVTDDLSAVIRVGGEKERIYLPRTDRWLLRRVDGVWRIVRLDVNLADRPAGLKEPEVGGAR